MFCSKCGKQIEDGIRFCPYCGNTQEEVNQGKTSINVNDNRGLLMGMSVVDIIIGAVYIIVALWWTSNFFSNLKGSWRIYEFMEADAKFIGMVLYMIPYALMLCIVIVGIVGVKNQEYHISTGIIIGIIGLVVKIGSVIFDEVSYKNYVVIAQRVFSVYGAIGLSTIVLGIIIVFLLYAKMNQRR